MNSDDHGAIGALLALGSRYLYKLKSREPLMLGDVLSSLFLGWIGGQAPDILEPPTSPVHRSLFHSKALLLFLAQWHKKISESPTIDNSSKQLLSELLAGYASHLVIDSQSAKGLPLL